jgi:F-type H+-transporting ATPase subunit delta
LAAIANRYARALVDVSFNAGQQETVGRELVQFEELLKREQALFLFYTNPAITVPRKKAATREILQKLGYSSLTSNFIFVLLDNHRLSYFSEIRRAFEQVANERLGVVEAQVTTATKIDSQIRPQLESRLAQMTGKKVLLKFEVDRELIGGVITRIGDTIYDGSVRQQLSLIKARLSSD